MSMYFSRKIHKNQEKFENLFSFDSSSINLRKIVENLKKLGKFQ